MKTSFSFVALLAGAANAAVDVGPWSYSRTDTTTLLNADGVKWQIKTKTAYDEDAGIEYFRI